MKFTIEIGHIKSRKEIIFPTPNKFNIIFSKFIFNLDRMLLIHSLRILVRLGIHGK